MPIYEFSCTECDHHYDDLVALDADISDQVCPKCSSSAVEKLLSSFSMHSSSSNATVQLDGTACLPGPASSGGGGGCCGGACGACG